MSGKGSMHPSWHRFTLVDAAGRLVAELYHSDLSEWTVRPGDGTGAVFYVRGTRDEAIAAVSSRFGCFVREEGS